MQLSAFPASLPNQSATFRLHDNELLDLLGWDAFRRTGVPSELLCRGADVVAVASLLFFVECDGDMAQLQAEQWMIPLSKAPNLFLTSAPPVRP